MKKKLLIIAISIVIVFVLFVTEESIRLKRNLNEKPLIIIDKIMCSKDDWVCYGEDGNYTEIYWGLGFTLKKVYYLDEKSSEDNHMYHLSGEEFLLFNKFRLWSWTA